ncbi:hypothetical protein ABFS83_14G063000 [Erythranthe nasuta]
MDHDSSDSSDERGHSEDSSHQGEKCHLFGRQNPVHTALGGGKPADVILWRNKQISAALLAGSTVIWLLFEWIGYYLVPFICHSLILSLATLFLWSNLSSFVNKSPINFPEIELPEDLCMNAALLLTERFNKAIGDTLANSFRKGCQEVPLCGFGIVGCLGCRKLVRLLDHCIHHFCDDTYNATVVREARGPSGFVRSEGESQTQETIQHFGRKGSSEITESSVH